MVSMNIDALKKAEGGAARRGGLAGMRDSFAQIASDAAMFGQVPNAASAAEALRSAAATMLRELERAGQSVEDIRSSAAAAAGIGKGTDDEARRTLTRAQAAAVSAFDRRMSGMHPPGSNGTGGG
jgi:hypothetical protein